MIRCFAIMLALLTACTVLAAEPPTELADVLQQVRIPRLKIDRLSIPDAIAVIQAGNRANNPTGKDINILYAPGKAQTADATPPLVQMEFADIPLFHALRYLALSTNMRYEIGRYAVMIYEPSRSPSVMSLRAFAVPERFANLDEPDPDYPPLTDDDFRDGIVDFLDNYGVVFQDSGCVSYNRATQRLLVCDTEQTHKMIAHILDEFVRQPTQVRVSMAVVEVTDPAALQALPPGEMSYAALMQLPPEQRRVLYRSSVIVASGAEVAVEDSQAATLDGETVRVHQSATIGATVEEDRYTTRLAVRWALAVDATGAEAGPRMRTALQTTVLQNDGQPEVFAVHSQQRGDVRSALYLVLTPILTLPDGRSKRNHDRD